MNKTDIDENTLDLFAFEDAPAPTAPPAAAPEMPVQEAIEAAVAAPAVAHEEPTSGDQGMATAEGGAPPAPPTLLQAPIGGGGAVTPPPSDTDSGDWLPLGEYAERCYLAYAMSVVTSRALPNVEDGQKPVQRRILYAMHEMGLSRANKHVKSARVVGDVIGKLHPHGDSSVYDALVRLAQDFTLRYPLIDGQGNFGSRDGDNAAAMRYTECRLTPIAELLLSEIDRGTVDFRPNYDGAFQEPELLPARLPMVMLNGASGIAVGMSTEIPPHNLREVAQSALTLIRDPQAPLDVLMETFQGPDFPGGGQIISSHAEIREAYATGRGAVRVRARWKVEELARGQWRVVVTELPPGTSTAKVMTDIEEASNPQPRTGKKEVSLEQKNLKALILSVLDAARDESDAENPVRLVLEPRSSRQNPDELMQILLANTSLEISQPINMVMLGRDGRPKQKNLRDILTEWIDFRYEVVTRRTQHRLSEVERRIHILEGRMIAFLSIEEVIRVIRESDEPKPALMERFGLSDVQAEDILEIRLRQLARLEGIKIEKELGELRDEREKLRHLLDSRNALTRLIEKEIAKDAETYGDDRRSLVEPVERATSPVQNVADEPVTIILSKNGWLRARSGHGIDPATISYKPGDSALAVMETRTVHPIIVIDTKGRAYSIPASSIPGGKGDGVPITSMIELQDGAKLSLAFATTPEDKFLVANTGGYGFIVEGKELVSRVRAGKAFMTLEAGEKMLPPARLQGELVTAVSGNGRLLVFPIGEMKEMSKGRGVIIMGLDDKEELIAVATTNEEVIRVEGTGRGGKTVVAEVSGVDLIRHLLHRARKGSLLPVKIKPERFV